MSDMELEQKINDLVRQERKIGLQILQLLNVAEDRKLYLKKSFSSVFNWMVHGLGYSESAAYRRLEAARILRAVPDAANQVISGQLNVTTLAAVQSMIRSHEKATKAKVSSAGKAKAVEQILNKSRRESEKVLLTLFPAATPPALREHKTTISPTATRLAINLEDTVLRDLDRIKEVLSHAMPTATYAEIIARIAREFLQRKDPLIVGERIILKQRERQAKSRMLDS